MILGWELEYNCSRKKKKRKEKDYLINKIKLFYNLGTKNQKVSFLFPTLIHRHTFERVDMLTVLTFLPPSLTWPLHSGFHSWYFTEIGFSTSVMMSILPYLMAKSFFFLNFVYQHISTSLRDTSGICFPGQHTSLAVCLSHCLLFWVLFPFLLSMK